MTYSSPRRADTWFPSITPKECHGRTEYPDVITKFSQMDSLPNFLTHGASLARASRPQQLRYEV